MLHVPAGDFSAAFDAVTSAWQPRRDGLNAIAAGMVGSPLGWVHVPYCTAPAGADELAAALSPVTDTRLHIVPGIVTLGEHADVMRGEETQIVGALELHPELATRSLLVLPGTHSKWVHVNDGKITAFSTYMTGELFAVLREHSILGRFAKQAAHAAAPPAVQASPDATDDAFTRGVLAARRSTGGLAPLLFSARSLVLTDRLAADLNLEYLSGLLIGDELRCGLMDGGRPAAFIGDAALCGRYAAALRAFEICDVPIIGDAAEAGLWRIACRAGLRSLAREGY